LEINDEFFPDHARSCGYWLTVGSNLRVALHGLICDGRIGPRRANADDLINI